MPPINFLKQKKVLLSPPPQLHLRANEKGNVTFLFSSKVNVKLDPKQNGRGSMILVKTYADVIERIPIPQRRI